MCVRVKELGVHECVCVRVKELGVHECVCVRVRELGVHECVCVRVRELGVHECVRACIRVFRWCHCTRSTEHPLNTTQTQCITTAAIDGLIRCNYASQISPEVQIRMQRHDIHVNT